MARRLHAALKAQLTNVITCLCQFVWPQALSEKEYLLTYL